MDLELFVDEFECLFAKGWHTEDAMLAGYKNLTTNKDEEIYSYEQVWFRYVPTAANRGDYDIVYVEAKPNARGAFKATIARGGSMSKPLILEQK